MLFIFFKFFLRFNIHLLTVNLFQYMSNEQKINVKIKKNVRAAVAGHRVVFTFYLQVIYNAIVISAVWKTNVRLLHDFYKSYRPCTLGEAIFLKIKLYVTYTNGMSNVRLSVVSLQNTSIRFWKATISHGGHD